MTISSNILLLLLLRTPAISILEQAPFDYYFRNEAKADRAGKNDFQIWRHLREHMWLCLCIKSLS